MQLSDKEQVRLREQVDLAQQYETFLKSPIGMDITKLLNDNFTDSQNQLVLEPHQRTGQVCTDTLRGRMQILSTIYNHINSRLRDGYRASEKLAKLTP